MNEKKEIHNKRNYSEDNKSQLNIKNKKMNGLLNDYDIETTLGEGNFGKVKLGIHKMTKEKVRI